MEKYFLTLYITGKTSRAERAVENLKVICESKLRGNCEVEIIDVFDKPDTVKEDNILMTPTLIKKYPLPERRVVGDLRDHEKVITYLELKAKRKKL